MSAVSIAAAGSLGSLQLLPAANVDRLPPMLFLAALIHGILIIGITFNAVLDNPFRDSISLEVIIIADPENTIDMPDEAEYLAQASQEGAGNTTETARPRAPMQSNMPIDNSGVEDGNSLIESMDALSAADQVLLSRADQDQRVTDSPRIDPQSENATAIALEAGLDATLPLPQDPNASLLIRADNPRQLVTSVNTKESKIAGYLDRWKRKIEAIGVRYFPEKGIIQGLAGSPTLEVTINSAGQLDEVYVRETSGSKVLDQAAIEILRRAAPFDPFPEAIRVDYDQLRFAYKWQFNDSGASTTASINLN